MLIKTILIFLAVMALIAMLGQAFFGKGRVKKNRSGVVKTMRCLQCGRWKFGRSGCKCRQ
jgi:hypothetical protein